MKIEKVEKFVANLHDKKEYPIHMINLKQALNHGLVFKKLHRVTKFNQKISLKPYIDVNTELSKNPKYNFVKQFFKLTNNGDFGECEKTQRSKKELFSVRTKLSYNKAFFRKFLVVEMKKHKYS